MGTQWKRTDWTRELFLTRCVIRTNGCWEWYKEGLRGYPARTKKNNKATTPYRLGYELFIGPIATGKHMDHLCRNTMCCNPFHVEPVSPQENLIRRGWKLKSYCKNGHPLTPDNVAWQEDANRPGGKSRFCRTCRNQRFRDRRKMKQLGITEYGIAKSYRPVTIASAGNVKTVWTLAEIKRRCSVTEAGCWIWPKTDRRGYSHRQSFLGKIQSPHRFSYALANGPIPHGLTIDHLCRNRPCVNPAHLETVTAAENNRRRPIIRKACCQKGHPYVPENEIWVKGTNARTCRQCAREAARRTWYKNHQRNLQKQRDKRAAAH